jgi:hypothetical protein
MNNVILTTDQEELMEHLQSFKNDNRCYFGVYGPAGSGKSFTIGYFINKNILHDKVILSGTTNNACRVLEQSLDSYANINIYEFIKNINEFISDILLNIKLLENTTNQINYKTEVLSYFNELKNFIFILKRKANDILYSIDQNDFLNGDFDIIDEHKDSINKRNKTLQCLKLEQINEIKNDILYFIDNNCYLVLYNKLYIQQINNKLLNIFNKNKYIKTIHSLLRFEQSRDENHNIVFLPSKSNISEIKTKKGIKYTFTPKLSGRKKNNYDNMNDPEKLNFDVEYYKTNFNKLTEYELLIIDESSMMKELEFQYVIYICKMLKLKVIFLGDKYQLPPVDDDKNIQDKIIDNMIDNTVNIDYSPAVKLKNSYTLSTIKRTSNPVLQDLYKTFRDLVEKTSQGKVKINNIQFTKNIQPTDKYLIKNNKDIQDVINYVKLYDTKLENTRILCFSNKEVERMNTIMRHHLYGNIEDKYVKDENLLVTNYMTLPILNSKQLIIIESCFENNNKELFNFIFNKIIENNVNKIPTNINNEQFKEIKNIFEEINNKENKLKLYTSCSIKIIKIIQTTVNIKNKLLNVNVIFFEYENNISLFFSFNKKESEYIDNMFKVEKQLIKLNTDLFRLHNCNENCNDKIKKHVCGECINSDSCIHHIQICNKQECTLVCNSCYECNPECLSCVKQHRNQYSTLLWNKYIDKEYLLEPSVNYSYATTVHKAQGQSIDNIIVSEYNIANCILHNNEVSLYQKMLIYPTCMYTAITRAKNILVRLK